jgi:hypothetical protein
MEMDIAKFQHLTNDMILKLFWFMLLYWASTFLKDFLTQVYRGWCVRQSESFKEGDLITIDGTHGRVLSIGYTVVKMQIEPYKEAPESIAYIPIHYFVEKSVRVYKYSQAQSSQPKPKGRH